MKIKVDESTLHEVIKKALYEMWDVSSEGFNADYGAYTEANRDILEYHADNIIKDAINQIKKEATK